jgi:hypothetical protein
MENIEEYKSDFDALGVAEVIMVILAFIGLFSDRVTIDATFLIVFILILGFNKISWEIRNQEKTKRKNE